MRYSYILYAYIYICIHIYIYIGASEIGPADLRAMRSVKIWRALPQEERDPWIRKALLLGEVAEEKSPAPKRRRRTREAPTDAPAEAEAGPDGGQTPVAEAEAEDGGQTPVAAPAAASPPADEPARLEDKWLDDLLARTKRQAEEARGELSTLNEDGGQTPVAAAAPASPPALQLPLHLLPALPAPRPRERKVRRSIVPRLQVQQFAESVRQSASPSGGRPSEEASAASSAEPAAAAVPSAEPEGPSVAAGVPSSLGADGAPGDGQEEEPLRAFTPAELEEEPWRAFTPAEVDLACCLARTWDGGRGGQCRKALLPVGVFCKLHASKWQDKLVLVLLV